MKPKKEKKGKKVEVDMRILTEAMKTEKPVDTSVEGAPLINTRGVAMLGENLEVHYDPRDPMLLIGGKKVLKVDLWRFVFSICDPKTRDALMPVRQTEMLTLTKVHMVQLKKDMKKGEIMKVRCQTNVPQLITETLGFGG